jgi:hypothetical protein
MSTYIVASLPLPLYCGILLLAKQHETKLVSIVYCSWMSRSYITLLILSSSCGFHANLLLSHIVAALFALFILLGARQIILMYSLARPRRLMASMPLYDIIVIHCGIMPTSLIAASCQLYCCISSSCNFHIVLYLYSGIRCHSHTPVGLYCYESSIRPYKVFLAASLPTLIAALLPTRFVVS